MKSLIIFDERKDFDNDFSKLNKTIIGKKISIYINFNLYIFEYRIRSRKYFLSRIHLRLSDVRLVYPSNFADQFQICLTGHGLY